MKKISILAVAALALSFASCKKERACECTFTSSTPGSTATTETVTYTKISKGDAKFACQKRVNVNTNPANTSTFTEDCKLK
jgi:hypothetical protein